MSLTLESAIADHVMICVERRYESSPVRGYVVAAGPDIFLMSVVSDRIRYDGFECFRRQDSFQYLPDPHREFAERVLTLRHERPPDHTGLEATSMAALIRTAGARFPVIAVHQEQIDATICRIGAVMVVGAHSVKLREISPSAIWSDTVRSYPLDSITRVNFGGDYEGALGLIGGVAPELGD
jgi:hypothetical protein